MKPIYITVCDDLQLIIIPDSDAHLDGHAVLTYSYSIYKKDQRDPCNIITNKESQLHLTEQNDPSYMGVVLFEEPEKLIRYRADGALALKNEEVQEIIAQINHYRNNPPLW